MDGTRGDLTLRGLPYTGGVILAHPKVARRALCVSSFPYDLTRDPQGNWISQLPARVVIGSVAMTAVLLVWTAVLMTLFLTAG